MAREPKDDEARKRRLIESFRTLAARVGGVPGIRRFLKEVDEKKHVWTGGLWPSWGAFLKDAGFEANELTQSIAEADLLRHLASLTGQFQRFPTMSELRFARSTNPEIPAEKTYRNRFGSQAAMISRLREWIRDQSGFEHVKMHLDRTPLDQVALRAPDDDPEPVASASDPLDESFVPPIIDCLPELAACGPAIEAICRTRGIDPNVEFEKRVASALRILGLDVERLGQGAGRVADGIARCRARRWAIIYDAKVRRSGFVMGTEDRKFREYIEHHASDLERDGVDAVYFAVISSRFEERDIEKAREVVRLTKAKAFALLEAGALRALVELNVRTQLLADWAKLERLFGVSSIITVDDVRRLT
jgi:hypothetical protein